MASIAPLSSIICIDYLAYGTIFTRAMFRPKKKLDVFFPARKAADERWGVVPTENPKAKWREHPAQLRTKDRPNLRILERVYIISITSHYCHAWCPCRPMPRCCERQSRAQSSSAPPRRATRRRRSRSSLWDSARRGPGPSLTRREVSAEQELSLVLSPCVSLFDVMMYDQIALSAQRRLSDRISFFLAVLIAPSFFFSFFAALLSPSDLSKECMCHWQHMDGCVGSKCQYEMGLSWYHYSCVDCKCVAEPST